MDKRVLTRKTARIIERRTTINLENIDPNSRGTSILFRNVTNGPFGRRRSSVSAQLTTVRHVALPTSTNLVENGPPIASSSTTLKGDAQMSSNLPPDDDPPMVSSAMTLENDAPVVSTSTTSDNDPVMESSSMTSGNDAPLVSTQLVDIDYEIATDNEPQMESTLTTSEDDALITQTVPRLISIIDADIPIGLNLHTPIEPKPVKYSVATKIIFGVFRQFENHTTVKEMITMKECETVDVNFGKLTYGNDSDME